MDLHKLESMAKLVDSEIGSRYGSFRFHPDLEASFRNLMQLATQALPEHRELFSVTYRLIDNEDNPIDLCEAKSVIAHLLKIIEIEKSSNSKLKEGKVFESAEEKLQEAANSFRKEDYQSTFHNLNTSLELVLKDKLGIPTTLKGINTSNIMDVLTKYKVENYVYLEEARKHILVIDNKIKHQGYSPTKIECINAIKAAEELVHRLRNIQLNVSSEIKEKIFAGL